MFYFPELKNPFSSFFKVIYNLLQFDTVYFQKQKLKHLPFSPCLIPSRIQKLLSNMLIFQDNMCIYVSPKRIYALCNRTQLYKSLAGFLSSRDF